MRGGYVAVSQPTRTGSHANCALLFHFRREISWETYDLRRRADIVTASLVSSKLPFLIRKLNETYISVEK